MLVSNGFQSEYELGFANGLAESGWQPLLVASDRTLRDRLNPAVLCINLRGSQDPRRSRWAKATNILRYLSHLFAAVRRSPLRVVHVTGLFATPSVNAWLVEALLLRIAARRFILTVHNLLPHDAHHRLNRWRFAALYRLPDALVVHTPRMRDELVRDFGLSASRIKVMEHGVDRVLAPSAGEPGWLRTQCGLAPDRPLLLFFGHVARYKGLDVLLTAFERVSRETGAFLVVAGACGDPGLRAELQGRLAPLVARGDARWFDGFVPEDRVIPYFHGSDLLVMPYRHIDQSGVMMMALATGLPTVASDVGALAHYAPLTGGGVVPPGDPEALADALVSRLRSLAGVDREAVVRNAERFLWRHTVAPVLSLYQESAA